MQAVILSIWVLQGLLMFFDEFYFHHKRGLGKWESIGHPIDSAVFLMVFVFSLSQAYTSTNLVIFAVLSFLSCLVITKDEWIHSEESSPLENWLHSLLFVIHPLALGALFFAWKEGELLLIQIQSGIVFLFYALSNYLLELL